MNQDLISPEWRRRQDPTVLLRLALLHLANAIGHEDGATRLHPVRQKARRAERDEQIGNAIELLKAAKRK